MKNLIFITAAVIFLSGCTTGYKYTSFEPGKDGIVRYHSTNTTLLSEAPSPVELARASTILKEPEIRLRESELQIKQLEELRKMQATTPVAQPRKSGDVLVIKVVNNDASKSCFIYHPLVPGYRIFLKPRGGWQLVEALDMPRELILYNPLNDQIMGRISLNSKEMREIDLNGVIIHKEVIINKL